MNTENVIILLKCNVHLLWDIRNVILKIVHQVNSKETISGLCRILSRLSISHMQIFYY